MQYVKQVLRYLLKHLELLEALRSEFGSMSFTPQEFSHIAKSVADYDLGSVDVNELFAELCNKDLIIEVARAENQYDINPNILEVVELLTQQEQLGLSASLKAEIDELSKLVDRLGLGIDQCDPSLVQRYIGQLDRRFRAVNKQLSSNEQAILRIIEKAKTSGEEVPLKSRYALALDAWHDYIEPTYEMIDAQGEYEKVLQHVERSLNQFKKQIQSKMLGSKSIDFEKLHFRLLDLRSTLRYSITRCQRLLEPIYRRIKKSNKMTKGAALAIEEMRRSKFAFSKTPSILPLVGRIRPTVMETDIAITGYLAQLVQYKPPVLDLPKLSDKTDRREPVTLKNVEKALQASLPVEDCMTWLINNYPELETRQILEFMSRLTNESKKYSCDLNERESYETVDCIITMQKRSLALPANANKSAQENKGAEHATELEA